MPPAAESRFITEGDNTMIEQNKKNMESLEQKHGNQLKKSYHKPLFLQIQLFADQVLTTCFVIETSNACHVNPVNT
jgi:hypothetical protein